MANVLTRIAKGLITGLLAASSLKYIGFGTGAGTSSATDTTLFTEDYSSSNTGTQNTRVSGTQSQQTTTTTNDTYQVVGTLSAAHSTAVTNAGIFDTAGTAANLTTAPSGGNLFIKSDFSTINLNTNDSLQLTFALQLT